MDEKRAFDRYTLWFPVTVDANSREVWAVCRDASAGGILISGSRELAVGDHVTVSFRIAPNEPHERKVKGRIVRIDPPDDAPRLVWRHRMAIEFFEPVPELHTRLKTESSRPPPL